MTGYREVDGAEKPVSTLWDFSGAARELLDSHRRCDMISEEKAKANIKVKEKASCTQVAQARTQHDR
jgi:hypothetical protein